MRFVRPFLALAALCAAAACADGASRITAPEAASRDVLDEGGWAGSGNIATTESEPSDSTSDGRGGTWIGSGN